MRPITNPECTRLVNVVFDKTTQVIVPGSDKYNLNVSMNATGKYFASKYHSSGSKVWNPPSSQRFNKSCIN